MPRRNEDDENSDAGIRRASKIFVDEDQFPIAFFLHNSIRDKFQRSNLIRLIERHGGTVLDVQEGADTVLVGDSVDRETLQLAYDANRNPALRKIYVEPLTFVQSRIKSGRFYHRAKAFEGMGGAAPGLRTEYTKEDEENMCHYIAMLIPNKAAGGRLGLAFYEKMVEVAETDPEYAWARRHPPQSWRQHYKKKQRVLDSIIANKVRDEMPSGKQLYFRNRNCNRRSHNSLSMKRKRGAESESDEEQEVEDQLDNESENEELSTTSELNSTSVRKRKHTQPNPLQVDHSSGRNQHQAISARRSPHDQEEFELTQGTLVATGPGDKNGDKDSLFGDYEVLDESFTDPGPSTLLPPSPTLVDSRPQSLGMGVRFSYPQIVTQPAREITIVEPSSQTHSRLGRSQDFGQLAYSQPRRRFSEEHQSQRLHIPQNESPLHRPLRKPTEMIDLFPKPMRKVRRRVPITTEPLAADDAPLTILEVEAVQTQPSLKLLRSTQKSKPERMARRRAPPQSVENDEQAPYRNTRSRSRSVEPVALLKRPSKKQPAKKAKKAQRKGDSRLEPLIEEHVDNLEVDAVHEGIPEPIEMLADELSVEEFLNNANDTTSGPSSLHEVAHDLSMESDDLQTDRVLRISHNSRPQASISPYDIHPDDILQEFMASESRFSLPSPKSPKSNVARIATPDYNSPSRGSHIRSQSTTSTESIPLPYTRASAAKKKRELIEKLTPYKPPAGTRAAAQLRHR